MFIIDGPENDVLKRNHRVLNPVSRTSLKWISMTQRSSGYAFVLQSGQVSIPFETSVGYEVDESTGKGYLLTRFERFGASLLIEDRTGIQAYQFRDEEDESSWKRLAAEAVLIFGGSYNGPKSPPELYRVELDGKILTRRDFGYPS